MTYETVASLTQSFSLIFFILLFALILTYALWPSNKQAFDHAASLPLDDEENGLRDRGEKDGR